MKLPGSATSIICALREFVETFERPSTKARCPWLVLPTASAGSVVLGGLAQAEKLKSQSGLTVEAEI